MREYLLYIKESRSGAKSMITPCFALDKMYWKQQDGNQLHLLGKSSSLSLIFLLRNVVNQLLVDRSPQVLSDAILLKIRTSIQKTMQEIQHYAPFTFFPLISSPELTKTSEPISLIETERCANDLIKHMAGRALLLEEIEYISKVSRINLVWSIHWLVLMGRANWQPGITLQVKKGWIKHHLIFMCQRCGAADEAIQVSSCCRGCGVAGRYCSRCLEMGRSTCCTPYICMPKDKIVTPLPVSPLLQWKGTFSPLQEEAARRAVAFVRDKITSEFLIWAVCGAGKTELVFPVINEVLSRGGRVLLATPRKDVVLELTPRLKKAFPSVAICSVHGSSEEKWEEGQLIISTTHQVLRMYQAFELVILDEVDAFPYHNNPMLYRAVERAKAIDGKILYLSATPRDYLRLRLVGQDTFAYYSDTHSLIPSRFHGYPIPVPDWLLMPKWEQKIARSLPMKSLLESVKDSLDRERRVFVFVPRIADVDPVLSYLRKYLPEYGEKLEGVYSSDKARDEKVLLFRQNLLRLLVTTTILERGVTIPRSDVVILGADCEIFDEASLVQIAGRVGRSADSPDGKVLFVVTSRSKQPKSAISQIKQMNKLGQELKVKVRETCGI
ncbi:DEAD/DEAH box helicase [Brevibacillus sp. SYSU BS000544]|uniref:DEAD/DEAH box helicase n=1 Tax=Brevibacillus sp. SYSU BS000544 TaxID=3416443 RepID=UPI003CE48EB5